MRWRRSEGGREEGREVTMKHTVVNFLWVAAEDVDPEWVLSILSQLAGLAVVGSYNGEERAENFFGHCRICGSVCVSVQGLSMWLYCSSLAIAQHHSRPIPCTSLTPRFCRGIGDIERCYNVEISTPGLPSSVTSVITVG